MMIDPEVMNELREFWQSFLEEEYAEEIASVADPETGAQHVRVSWEVLREFHSDLALDTVEQPDTVLSAADEAARELVQDRQQEDGVDTSNSEIGDENGVVRLVGLSDEHYAQPGEIRGEDAGRYIAVRGQVSRRTSSRSFVTEAVFECQRCGTQSEIQQPEKDEKLNEPIECLGCERQGPFALLDGESAFVDRREILVEDLPEKVQTGQGEEIEVVLRDGLEDAAEPGDRVTVFGVCRMHQPNDSNRVHEQYLDARAVEVEETDYEEIDIGEYEERVREIAAGELGDPYELLKESVAPRIHGYDIIKEAVMLQLFGGDGGQREDGTRDRGAIHVLILGDPGLAKSRLLGSIAEIAPRSEIASAKNATKAGLTGAVVDDGFGEDGWSVTGGALVRADKGIACIDEIDKMADGVSSSMHEAMASQQVQIHKADIHTRLPTRTAVLAAGNPKFGRFDAYEPIGEQIELSPTLLSRFDLIFMEMDQQDAERDEKVGEQLISGRELRKKAESESHSLSEAEQEEREPPLSAEEVRAYIALARQEVTPVVADEDVGNALLEAFLELRSAGGDNEEHPVSITPRKLEALHRLAEASARVRLSDSIELEDIERAKQLVLMSMREVGKDPETGDFDADVIETGESKTQRNRRKTLLALIEELQGEFEDGVPKELLFEELEKDDVSREKVEHTLERCKQQGEAYEPVEDRYRRC